MTCIRSNCSNSCWESEKRRMCFLPVSVQSGRGFLISVRFSSNLKWSIIYSISSMFYGYMLKKITASVNTITKQRSRQILSMDGYGYLDFEDLISLISLVSSSGLAACLIQPNGNSCGIKRKKDRPRLVTSIQGVVFNLKSVR